MCAFTTEPKIKLRMRKLDLAHHIRKQVGYIFISETEAKKYEL